MKKYQLILFVGGLLLSINAIFPPVTYERQYIDDRPLEQARLKTGRNFYAHNQFKYLFDPGYNGIDNFQVNLPRLAVQEFIIIGVMLALMGLTIKGSKPTEKKLLNGPENSTEQAGAGYPPQGVGSPDP